MLIYILVFTSTTYTSRDGDARIPAPIGGVAILFCSVPYSPMDDMKRR